MSLPHQKNVERGVVNGAYVPASVIDRQEYQREKLKTAFRNRPVFLETKIEPAAVNKPVAKKSLANVESHSTSVTLEDGAVLSSLVMQRQDNEKLKNEAGLRKLKADIQSTFVGEKTPDYSDKARQYSFVLPKATDTSPHRSARRKSFELLRGSKREYEIGQQYLADCGISTHWVYKCAPWKDLPICVENESDGAWVPFITLYREDYYECLLAKEHGHGREFSQDHGAAYD